MRRRKENILDTPISISAFTGAALEARGVERTDDLAKIVPNLVYQETPGAGVKNMLNKDYIIAASFTPGSGPLNVIPDRGREWYVSLKTSF